MEDSLNWRQDLRMLKLDSRPWPDARSWLEALLATNSISESWVWSLSLVEVEAVAAMLLTVPDLIPRLLLTLREHRWLVMHELANELEAAIAKRQAQAAQGVIASIRRSAR